MTEETKEATKKVETPEEIARRRELSRKRVARHRLKVRLAKSGGLLPSFWEYMDQMPKSHIKALDTYVRRISRQIATELPSLIRAAHPSDWAWRDGPPALREPEEEIVSYVAPIALRLEKGYGYQQVENGYLIGGLYGDAAAAEVVEYLHHCPGLLASPTFAKLYQDMLVGVERFYRKLPNSDLDAVRAELCGTYTLPPPPVNALGEIWSYEHWAWIKKPDQPLVPMINS